jgi:hypothetical protein
MVAYRLSFAAKFDVSRTGHEVIIYHPGRMHQRVADCRACKFESTPQQVAAHRIGLRSSRRYLGHRSPTILDRGRDLQPVAHNAFVAEPPQASRESPSKAGAKANSSAAPQNPADVQWPRNGRVTILEYEKVKTT